MYGQNLFNSFQFNDQPFINNYIHSVSAIQFNRFVKNGQRRLTFESNFILTQFITKAFLISRFK
ncbi:MAG: hypothetical protein A3G18_04815 [Rhodospirillales bacterium RIFCSPLOWO2_12_FULL_58_28]|nr:MAG: hypothetical protein A3H92_12585 [Rhodospirillales bacterium RIFCSPLOWO2_02_FULL_58_16]OHC79454.1 MAG: hypothetical protein A3G18_04815 [Rhodospirillales bacterium RIFCSPLOWO2_12_FULL_58_28]